jgi:hypothetical protein
VIGRLAARFGVVVRLTSSPSGGVSALVSLPNTVIDVQAPPEAVSPAVFEAPNDASSLTGPIVPLPAPPVVEIEPPIPAGLHVIPDVVPDQFVDEFVDEVVEEPALERDEPMPSPIDLGLTPIVEEPAAPVGMFDAPPAAPPAPETRPEPVILPFEEPVTRHENGHVRDHGLPPLPARQPGETMLPPRAQPDTRPSPRRSRPRRCPWPARRCRRAAPLPSHRTAPAASTAP